MLAYCNLFFWLTRTIGYRNSCVNGCKWYTINAQKKALGVYIYIYLLYLKWDMNVRKASLRPSVAGSGSSSTMGFISYYMVFVEEKPLISTAATQPTCRNLYQTLQPSLKFETGTVHEVVFNVAKIVIQGPICARVPIVAVAILWQPSGEGTVSETFEDCQRPKSVAGRRARLPGGFWVDPPGWSVWLLRTGFEVLL